MAKKAALRELTDALRSRGGVEYQTAKYPLQAQSEDYEWRDYVRGKDLSRYLKGRQDVLDEHTKAQGAGRTQEDQVGDLVVRLLQAKLLAPADRKFKKPKPGKKKVVKWPRTLEQVEDPDAWSEDLFYVFTYDKPTGALFYVGAALVVLMVLGATLFPLAPYKVKVVVLYFLTTLLFGMLGTILVRYVVWGAVWLVTGSHFWILPNLMSETLPVLELFKPFVQYTPRDPADKTSSLAVRGAVVVLLGGACWALLVLGPDASTVKSSMQDAQDSVLKYFDMVDSMKAGIANGTNTTGIELNTTQATSAGAAAEAAAGGAGQQAGAQPSGAGAAAAGGEASEEEEEEEWADAQEDLPGSGGSKGGGGEL